MQFLGKLNSKYLVIVYYYSLILKIEYMESNYYFIILINFVLKDSRHFAKSLNQMEYYSNTKNNYIDFHFDTN